MRLAFRPEGKFYNAYLVTSESEKDWFLFGTIRRGISRDPKIFEAFVSLMRDSATLVITDITGKPPVWGNETIPMSQIDRGGNA